MYGFRILVWDGGMQSSGMERFRALGWDGEIQSSGLGYRVQMLVFARRRVWFHGRGNAEGAIRVTCLRVNGLGFRAQSVGCRVQGAGCRVQGVRCRVQGEGCRV